MLGNQQAVGAGGTVLVKAATLSGGGTIDARGANSSRTYEGCNSSASGGGGRIGLLVETLSGFDPASQTTAKGGVSTALPNQWCNDAGPGTVFVKTSNSTYGDLTIDAGANANGTDRTVPVTPLPSLGSGSASAFAAAGADAWLSRTGNFAEHWLGAWVELLDGASARWEFSRRWSATVAAGCGWPAPAARPAPPPSRALPLRFVDPQHGAGMNAADPVEAARDRGLGQIRAGWLGQPTQPDGQVRRDVASGERRQPGLPGQRQDDGGGRAPWSM